jgi:hypothetical protein
MTRLAAIGLVTLALGAPGPARAAGGSFEDVAAQATAVNDLAMLLPPFVDDCGKKNREPERSRCLGVRASLRRTLPGKSFIVTRPGAEAVTISNYDGAIKGFHLAVSGCLACNPPVQAGGERRFLTLKVPAKGAKSLRAGTELARTNVTFASTTESEQWSRAVRPKLRAEYVFRPADEPWTAGASRGLSFKAVAFRVFDPCTGTVVFSQPPSREAAPRHEDAGCKAEPQPVASNADRPAPNAYRPPLEPSAINSAVGTVRPAFDACIKRYPMPGTATLVFAVASTGMPQSVAVEGGPAGTALGQCLIDAGTRIRFPEFRGTSQRFKYPLPLQK